MDLKTLTTLQSQVEYCLENDPITRDSDICLMIAIWKTFKDVDNTIELNELYDLPREDNIKRIRARIQNRLGLYLPNSWEVAKQRRINRQVWESYLNKFNIKEKDNGNAE